ncbi:MAG: hypothetical protein KGJ07_01375 [Patescibacteria group bacterium]|nr:hypothetical protein [Patescibacteria group bacterium]
MAERANGIGRGNQVNAPLSPLAQSPVLTDLLQQVTQQPLDAFSVATKLGLLYKPPARRGEERRQQAMRALCNGGDPLEVDVQSRLQQLSVSPAFHEQITYPYVPSSTREYTFIPSADGRPNIVAVDSAGNAIQEYDGLAIISDPQQGKVLVMFEIKRDGNSKGVKGHRRTVAKALQGKKKPLEAFIRTQQDMRGPVLAFITAGSPPASIERKIRRAGGTVYSFAVTEGEYRDYVTAAYSHLQEIVGRRKDASLAAH